MAKMGRPTKYKPEYCKKLVEYFRNWEPFENIPIKETMNEDGACSTEMKAVPNAPPSLARFADSLDVTRDCLYKWAEKYPDFLYALRQANNLGELYHKEGALLGRYNANFAQLVMLNRYRWRNKLDQDIELKLPEPILIQDEKGKPLFKLGVK